VLLNSGYGNEKSKHLVIKEIDFDGMGVIKVVTPPSGKYFRINHLVNIIKVPAIVSEIIARYGAPRVAWFYNGYAFEMRVAKYLAKKYKSYTILEFEDWHFARQRFSSPKPYLDWLSWRITVKHLNAGVAVNNFLVQQLENFGIRSTLLPGVVLPSVAELPLRAPPFLTPRITIGYFGGLSLEKGADKILSLVAMANQDIDFIVTGSGALQSKFEDISRRIPHRLKFLGAIPEAEMIAALSKADVIVNAHNINNGIFPFKVIEALASGRLLISTNLPIVGFENFADAIEFYDGTKHDLLSKVNNARTLYEKNKTQINLTADMVSKKYGQKSLIKIIGDILALSNKRD
jgi:glycosyltransferase involved in cell wall biosynthesis